MRTLLLGIDSGQTVGKVGVYDLAGRLVASASAPTAVSHPHPRWAERDMAHVWQQVASAISQVVRQLGPDDVVAGVGVCGHNDGAYPVDAALRPVRPAILATDSRARAQAAAIGQPGQAERALELTGLVPFVGAPAAVYGWLRDEEPEAFATVRWALFCKDWIRLQLTGTVASDPTDACASFLGLRERRWSAAALELFGLSALAAAMPPLVEPAAVAGTVSAQAAAVTGLAAGTPVVAGAHDVDAAALGIGAVTPGAASLMLGTFSINQVVTDRPDVDPRWQARAWLEPGRWLAMSTSPAGAVNFDWAMRRLGPLGPDGEPDPVAAVAEVVRSGLDARDRDLPLFLPFLFGAPRGTTAPGAAWIGVHGWHERGQLLHAVLEGVAFNHRTHLDGLREAFAFSGAVRASGGGARSPEWTQLLADVLDRPVEVTDATEAGTAGAAVLAGIGIGAYAGLDDAVARTVRVVRAQEPRPEQVAYRAGRYDRYLTAATGAPA